tara:strand:+ start:511 stop:810 length:300 start_codon:yes stop_codon:yes gene_type:complete
MSAFQDVAKKYGITPEQVKELKLAMMNTWGEIYYDWMDLFGSEQEAINTYGSEAKMVAEATIDADRIMMYGDTDLAWLHDMPRGLSRLKLGEETWNCRW